MIGIYAHRGASFEAPENTMSAFKRAVELGADGIEIDVHITTDNKLAVIHDYNLERTTDGRGLVSDYDSVYLKSLDAGSKFSPKFAGEPIPMLEDVLELIKKSEKKINIEFKADIWKYKDMAAVAMDMIKLFGLQDKCIISSFDFYSLIEVNKICHEIKTATLYSNNLCYPWDYAKQYGFSALHPQFNLVNAEMIEKCKENGIQVNPWTVDKEEDIVKCLNLGVNHIISNNAGKAIKLRNDFEK